MKDFNYFLKKLNRVGVEELFRPLTQLHIERIREWVEALKSGGYKQGRGLLKCGENYCCLGVASDIFIKSPLNTGAWRWNSSTNKDDNGIVYFLEHKNQKGEFEYEEDEVITDLIGDYFGLVRDTPYVGLSKVSFGRTSELVKDGNIGSYDLFIGYMESTGLMVEGVENFIFVRADALNDALHIFAPIVTAIEQTYLPDGKIFERVQTLLTEVQC